VKAIPLALLVGLLTILACSMARLALHGISEVMRQLIVANLTRSFLIALAVFWGAKRMKKENGTCFLAALIAWVATSAIFLGITALHTP